MKVYRNIKEIKKKETLGRRFSLAGLVVLFLGLMVTFFPTWYPPDKPIEPGVIGFLQQYWSWLSFGALFIGFLCASAGAYFINRYARRRWPGSKLFERPDEVLERSMKGFDDKFAFYSQSLPASYVLAGPNGVTVVAVRGDKGRFVVDGDRWREPFSFMRMLTFFAREGVGNPAKDLEAQKESIRALLATGTDLAAVPIEGAAVFLNQEAQLELTNPTIPVLRADQVKDYIRSRTKEVKLSNKIVLALNDHLVKHAVYQEVDTE
ncbi:MAG: hypothetical protein IPK16_02340 [Anaerolineales bacterium]|nr:hypothetical protein [Anaerolineales bacterium]